MYLVVRYPCFSVRMHVGGGVVVAVTFSRFSACFADWRIFKGSGEATGVRGVFIV